MRGAATAVAVRLTLVTVSTASIAFVAECYGSGEPCENVRDANISARFLMHQYTQFKINAHKQNKQQNIYHTYDRAA